MIETPLAKKLGIKEGSRVAIVNQPDDLDVIGILGPVPQGVRFFDRASEHLDVLLFFSDSQRHLKRRFGVLAGYLDPAGGLWVAYPKKSSGVGSDLYFGSVQQIGLDEGLVDNKSCAVDETWTAVRFVRRLKDRPSR